jgi:transposase
MQGFEAIVGWNIPPLFCICLERTVMTTSHPSINQTPCRIYELFFSQPAVPCDLCQGSTVDYSTANRTAIDIDLEQPILLSIKVSVHYCPSCDHYFRFQPSFMRPGAIYSNRVVNKAVESVYQDGMAMRKVADRLARDFWVRPSEAMIRSWCRDYSATFDFETDYQAWVVSEFSGILCVDEVYQGKLALLLGVDPGASDGDRLIGYELIHGPVDGDCVEGFLNRIKEAGVEPDQVITDGSALYPTLLAKVWPKAAHQLCLFHETRRVTAATMKVIQAIRKSIPCPPPKTGARGGGPLRTHPPSDDPEDPATQRWRWRKARRQAQIDHVHGLARKGLSQRAIARETGHHRSTVKRWLEQAESTEAVCTLPELPEEEPSTRAGRHAIGRQAKKAKRTQAHALRKEGLSYSEIARRLGIHRVTISKWLQQDPPASKEVPPESSASSDFQPPPPPVPWKSWDEVRQVREVLKEHRFLMLRRPERLSDNEQEHVEMLLNSAAGSQLRIARSFLVDWYRLWTDEEGQRRSLDDAKARFEAWRTNPDYREIPALKKVLGRMTDAKFEHMSQFLRNSSWEATNNGAERTGRAFRHRQAPHFNLRKTTSIENAIVVSACLRKQANQEPAKEPFHTCQRGRYRRKLSVVQVQPP